MSAVWSQSPVAPVQQPVQQVKQEPLPDINTIPGN